MSLLGIMTFIGYQSLAETGWEKHAASAWIRRKYLFYPASIHHDFPRHCIQETENNIDYITTKYQLTTVLKYDDVQSCTV
jgi:hypothetical protein